MDTRKCECGNPACVTFHGTFYCRDCFFNRVYDAEYRRNGRVEYQYLPGICLDCGRPGDPTLDSAVGAARPQSTSARRSVAGATAIDTACCDACVGIRDVPGALAPDPEAEADADALETPET